MEGVRSAWAAAWRRALVANILRNMRRKVVVSDRGNEMSESRMKGSWSGVKQEILQEGCEFSLSRLGREV